MKYKYSYHFLKYSIPHKYQLNIIYDRSIVDYITYIPTRNEFLNDPTQNILNLKFRLGIND